MKILRRLLIGRHFAFLLIAICLPPGAMLAQKSKAPAPPPSTSPSSEKAVTAQLIALRDSFVSEIKAEGFQPSLPPPNIILDNPPSYGAYDDDTNVVHVALWEQLGPEQQAQFADLFGQGDDGGQAFAEIVQHWIFTHELGHWWQACQHRTGGSHYAQESGASRIAAAYWRVNDAAFMDKTAKKIALVRDNLRSMVPPDEQNEEFFNENYKKLGPTPAYIWFQCDMVSKVLAERPLPSYRQALEKPLYP
jgi:hypothetical protein